MAELVSSLAGRRILVTGSTGFKGSWLCLALARAGAEVTGLALDPPTEPSLFDRAGIGDLLVADVRADIRDRVALRRTVAACRPELVFHLAAQPLVRRSYLDPAETFDVNVGGTVALLDVLRETGAPSAVLVVTSDKCYLRAAKPGGCTEDDPLGGHDPYSASKAATEIVAASYRASFPTLSIATARAGNVVGGGDWAEDRLVPDAVRALRRNLSIEVRNPQAVRPWQHVLEPVAAYLTLGRRLLDQDPAVTTAFNLGPDPAAAAPVADVVGALVHGWGSGCWHALGRTAGPFEQPLLTLDSSRAGHVLGWSPVWSLEQTLRRTVDWYRAEPEASSAAVRARCVADQDAHAADAAAAAPTPLPRQRQALITRTA
ncbi:MAG: CDP-glucose 4,6-dehydratase [Frankiaceae bacterium]|nr:CDP-glucose 4,6-dehydratase [Frankiaceae bacterium]